MVVRTAYFPIHIGGAPIHKKGGPTGIIVRVLEFGMFACAPGVGAVWTNPALAVCFPLLRVPFSTLGLQANDWSDRILKMYAGSHAVLCQAFL